MQLVGRGKVHTSFEGREGGKLLKLALFSHASSLEGAYMPSIYFIHMLLCSNCGLHVSFACGSMEHGLMLRVSERRIIRARPLSSQRGKNRIFFFHVVLKSTRRRGEFRISCDCRTVFFSYLKR